MKKFYGIDSEKAIKFFTVHEEADVYHSRDEIELIVNKELTLEDQRRLVNTVNESATLMWKFLDGVYNNYCVN